ncbi:MAG: hypothetical protein SFX18_00630 [Pirellulales bacterium]|nr:hypothetical protein [Pirellulales bacterium]
MKIIFPSLAILCGILLAIWLQDAEQSPLGLDFSAKTRDLWQSTQVWLASVNASSASKSLAAPTSSQPPRTASLAASGLASRLVADNSPANNLTSQSNPVPPEQQQQIATSLLERARQELSLRPALTATIRMQVDLLDQQLIGSGQYWQTGTGADTRVRWEMRVQHGAQATPWLQIADGRYVWTSARTIGGPLITRLDLQRLRYAQLKSLGYDPLDTGEIWAWAGLPQFLQNVEKHWQLQSVVGGTLEPRQTAAWALHARWQPSSLQSLAPPPAGEKSAEPGVPFQWPPHLPAALTLYLRQSDFLPLRWEYRRPPADDSTLPPEQWPICLIVELVDPLTPAEIDSRIFKFYPAKQELLDVTENVITSLKIAE